MEQLLCPNCYEASPVETSLCVKCTATTILQGRYRLRKRLGMGGTSQVFLADDLTEKQPRAIKVLQVQGTKDWKGIEHFERQLSILQSLNHPGIPKVYSHFEQDFIGRLSLFSVQEWIEGENLDERIKKGLRLQEKDAARLLEQLLEIVAYLHGFSPPVIHRDIKPKNIILRQDGSPALIDFDTARGVAIDKERADGTMVGTAGFVPMEQLAGQAAPASDLYALGMTMIALLSHKDILEIPVERMRLKFEGYINVSEQLVSILQKMIEPAIEDRYQSTSEVLADVKRPAKKPERHKPSYIPHKKQEERRHSAPQARAKNSSPRLSSAIKPARKEGSSFLELQRQIERLQEETQTNPQPAPSGPIEEAKNMPYRQASFFDLQEGAPSRRASKTQAQPRRVASGSRGWVWVLVLAGFIVVAFLLTRAPAMKQSSLAEPLSGTAISSNAKAPTAEGESIATFQRELSPEFSSDIVWASSVVETSSVYKVFTASELLGPPKDFYTTKNNYLYWQPENLNNGPAWAAVQFEPEVEASAVWVVELGGAGMLIRVDDLTTEPAQVLWSGPTIGEEKTKQAAIFTLPMPRKISKIRVVYDTSQRIEWVKVDAIGLIPVVQTP